MLDFPSKISSLGPARRQPAPGHNQGPPTAGLTYGHGTGHGVGAFASVHEGPFSLAERDRSHHGPQPLHAGYVTSIEPGY